MTKMIDAFDLMSINSTVTLPLNELIELRIDQNPEFQCLLQQHFDKKATFSKVNEVEYYKQSNQKDNNHVIRNQSNNGFLIDSKYCDTQFDSILCWPRTPTDTIAILPCLKEFQGIKYDSTRKF